MRALLREAQALVQSIDAGKGQARPAAGAGHRITNRTNEKGRPKAAFKR